MFSQRMQAHLICQNIFFVGAYIFSYIRYNNIFLNLTQCWANQIPLKAVTFLKLYAETKIFFTCNKNQTSKCVDQPKDGSKR